MERSQRIRLRDLRAVYLLVGECCEVGRDPYAWHLRAFEGLREVLGVRVGLANMAAGGIQTFHYQTMLGEIDWGWDDDQERQVFKGYERSDSVYSDPTFVNFRRQSGKLIVRRREELVETALWFNCPHFNEYYRRSRVNSGIYMMSTPPRNSGVRMHIVNLFRALGDRGFSVRDSRIAWLFFREVRRLLGTKLVPFGHPAPYGLSPRLREVLALLAAGRSEKQVAHELSISPHTVHDYVKELHKRFGASSRAELLARSRPLLGPVNDGRPPNSPPLPEP